MSNLRLSTAAFALLLALTSGCGGGGGGGEDAAPSGPPSSGAPGTPASPTSTATPAPPTATAEAPPSVNPEDDPASLARILSSGRAIGLGADDSVREREAPFEDELGETHVRFERFHEGLYVVGGDFVVHSLETRGEGGFSATVRAPLALDVAPELTSVEAINAAVPTFRGALTSAPRADLLIDAIEAPALAWDVLLEGQTAEGLPSALHVLVDARTGEVRRSVDEVETLCPWHMGPPWAPWNRCAPPGGTTPTAPTPTPVTRTASLETGNSIHSGQVQLHAARLSTGAHELRDLSAENADAQTIDLFDMMTTTGLVFTDGDGTWGNSQTTDRASAGVDAHHGARVAYDYFLSAHGRRGVANDGKGVNAGVHFGRNLMNAFWLDACSCMSFGDGIGGPIKPFVAVDIVAHEMTHGVTAHSARLVYSGESGGLNEATSDIFGACAEFFAASPADPADWLIGEKLFPPGGALRSMSDPRSDTFSIDSYSLYRAGIDVHYSSGIANNFFFLLSQGGTNRTSGRAVTGIGRDKAARIWYRALTVYMTSATGFAGARVATLSAAGDLFGASSVERAAVATAWGAVGVP